MKLFAALTVASLLPSQATSASIGDRLDRVFTKYLSQPLTTNDALASGYNLESYNCDPVHDNFLGLFFASLMALAFAFAQVFSRQLRDLDISLTNAFTGLFGFIILLIVSSLIEGDTISSMKSISRNSWILISYLAIVVSLGAHLMMFYLYKFYTVGQIFPSYSLFPIFGIALSFLIFGEVPSILFILGGIIVISSVFLLHKIR